MVSRHASPAEIQNDAFPAAQSLLLQAGETFAPWLTLEDSPAVRAARLHAAGLLQGVIDETLTPRQGLNRWPALAYQRSDASLNAAYQALWHFESDEDWQRNELFYVDVQLDLLRQMAHALGKGQPLPAYMLARYGATHQVRFYDATMTQWSYLLNGLISFIIKSFTWGLRLKRLCRQAIK